MQMKVLAAAWPDDTTNFRERMYVDRVRACKRTE